MKPPASLRRPAGIWAVRSERVVLLKPNADEKFPTEPKLKRIVDSLGLSATADMLDVDKSYLGRYLKGQEKIGAELVRRITDFEFIIDRALQVMNPEEVGPWLAAPEPLLGNSVPMNVLAISGPARVVNAIDAIGAGAFA